MAEKRKVTPKTEYEKQLSHYMDVWIVYVLRTFSDSDHPLTKTQIVDRISVLTGLGDNTVKDEGINPIEKTIGRRLKEMESLGRSYGTGSERTEADEAFYRVIGGRVLVAARSGPKAYYFEPILDSGDVSLICSALESNHYLSPEEKNYLISRESAACGYREDEEENDTYGFWDLWEKKSQRLPQKPTIISDPTVPPAKAPATLLKISLIQFAIRKKLKIKVVSGSYSSGGKKIVFGPKEGSKESVLNPYAMICQNGQYYVIVTHDGHDNPTHYRIDRLYSVELVRKDDKKIPVRYEHRQGVPDALKCYFNKNKFKTEEYTSNYPLMAFNDDKMGLRHCSFLCEANASSIVIDYFGIWNTVHMEKAENDAKVMFRVKADYENVKMFCIQQHQFITPVEPPELKAAVKQSLKEAFDKI